MEGVLQLTPVIAYNPVCVCVCACACVCVCVRERERERERLLPVIINTLFS